MARRTFPFPYRCPGISEGGETGDLETFGRLIDDLHRYAADGGPTPQELAAAPLIDAPQLVVDPSAVRLVGTVSGHPRVGPGLAATSRVYAVDIHGLWVRSYSRLWRIGDASLDLSARFDQSRRRRSH